NISVDRLSVATTSSRSNFQEILKNHRIRLEKSECFSPVPNGLGVLTSSKLIHLHSLSLRRRHPPKMELRALLIAMVVHWDLHLGMCILTIGARPFGRC